MFILQALRSPTMVPESCHAFAAQVNCHQGFPEAGKRQWEEILVYWINIFLCNNARIAQGLYKNYLIFMTDLCQNKSGFTEMLSLAILACDSCSFCVQLK